MLLYSKFFSAILRCHIEKKKGADMTGTGHSHSKRFPGHPVLPTSETQTSVALPPYTATKGTVSRAMREPVSPGFPGGTNLLGQWVASL